MTPSVSSSLRALLVGSVDYAGLFPPAGLALEPAIENQAVYARGGDAWMLGRFIVPTGKLTEVEHLLDGRFTSAHRLGLSALGSKASSADECLENLRTNLGELVRFGQAHGEETTNDQFEAVMSREAAESIRQAADLIEALVPWPLQVFWELPLGDGLPANLRRFAQHNEAVRGTARGCRFGLKIRTGGTDAAAFPTPAKLASDLFAARDANVAVKFTAGLHHPVRHFNESLGTRMHGFLNVFAAGILAREHPLDLPEIQAILEEERPQNFRFDDDGFVWCDRHVSTASVAAHREFVTGFGSCSFDEPRDDLRLLELLP